MPYTVEVHALRSVSESIASLEEHRARMANVYSLAQGPSAIEVALGNSVSAIRRALKELRGAQAELSQMRFSEPPKSRAGQR